ncbi:MAG: ATP-binding protein [Kofleriaceae bacterium]
MADRLARQGRNQSRVQSYFIATAGVTIATLIGMIAEKHELEADQPMLYMMAILVSGLGGRGPGVYAALIAVASFDFFFVEPQFTFAAADGWLMMTFGMLFVVGAATGTLVARLRDAEAASQEREQRTAALLAFTRDAAAASDFKGVVAAVRTHVRDATGVGCEVTIQDEAASPHDGPVVIKLNDESGFTEDQRLLVDAVARQAGVAVGRLQLASTARDAALRAKAEELRSSLLSTVSHDLRTPLAVITGMATTLRDEAKGPQREALDTIVDEAGRLSRILINLLSITKVESGAAPRREWVPLEELVGAALGRLEQSLSQHPIFVHVAADAMAHIDPILVEQLLINLLENAAKHTPVGTQIEVRGMRNNKGATLEVSDSGPGLPPGPPSQVFDKFFRGKDAAAGGVGLGLAVCRGIATAHKGTIDAHRRAGGGCTFRVWFPDAGQPPELIESLAETG